MASLRIGIVGSRRRISLFDRDLVRRLVCNCADYDSEITIVSGGCRTGADAFAEEFAKIYGLQTLIHPVPLFPPIRDRGDFRARAFVRNSLVARDSDWLYALVSKDRTGGTEDTVRKAADMGKKVVLVMPDGSCVPYIS